MTKRAAKKLRQDLLSEGSAIFKYPYRAGVLTAGDHASMEGLHPWAAWTLGILTVALVGAFREVTIHRGALEVCVKRKGRFRVETWQSSHPQVPPTFLLIHPGGRKEGELDVLQVVKRIRRWTPERDAAARLGGAQ